VRHEQLKDTDSFDVVASEAIAGEHVLEQHVSRPERAVPDVPATIGTMMIAIYVLLIGMFALTIANAGMGLFVIAVDAAFLAAFFTIPYVVLKQEKDSSRRPSLGRFMDRGMQTYTGHVTGGGALAQMFVVPVLLTFAVLAIGIIAILA
jgi:hypothetical protein